VVHVVEGFASAWKARNVAFTLANGTFGGSSYTYNGGTTYPAQAAQNVAGTIYNSEDMYLYNALTAVPSPNPPAGFGGGPVANLGNPLLSAGLGLTNTGIDQDGSSSAGTRVALTFTHTPAHSTVTVPSMVFLHSSGSPLTNSGVMVLTTTDAAGAGAFAAGASTDIPDGGTAVYEVLFADPYSIEFADIPCTVNHAGNGTKVAVSFAPFYSVADAGFATPTPAHLSPTAVPRFIPAAGTMALK
jgi:peptidoglycan hydrolase-like protein with peptidoglycan-binding domain